jgi:RNA polymerase sigma-70 factor (ECF subfamily)
MTDEMQWIQRVLDGDTAVFRSLVERYQRPVMSMIRHLTGLTTDCEDIAQEVFLSAFRNLKSFDPERSRFSTWLFMIARNKSINALRRNRHISLKDSSMSNPCDEPDELLERREVFRQLDQALTQLPETYRRAFILAEFENLPYDRIAQIECVGLGTVKSRIHRAKEKLQRALAQFRGDES